MMPLVGAFKAGPRHLADGAMHPDVGDLARPSVEMRLECRPARKDVTGNGVALDVADAALVLALGARPIRRAGPRPETPSSARRHSDAR